MAQFDVHRNAGRHKVAIPFVVIVQSSQFKDYRRKVVVPLVRAEAISPVRFRSFNPAFTIKGVAVVLHALEIVSVPTDRLGSRESALRLGTLTLVTITFSSQSIVLQTVPELVITDPLPDLCAFPRAARQCIKDE